MTGTINGSFVQRNKRQKDNKQRSSTYVSVDNILKMSFLGLLCLYLYNFFVIAYRAHSESSGSGSSSSISNNNNRRIKTIIDDVTEAGATTEVDHESTSMGNNNFNGGAIQEKEEEDNLLPRVLALVFPQFHQDPLNDYLWGKGFTDWDNLRKAPAKNRNGFAIPRPTELGYYDYTDVEPRKKQGELALQYGIDGFLYHHYWFYDKDHPGPNLHQPIVNMLKDGHPDMPFALHWCGIKWTNTWSGNVGPDFVFKEGGVLQKQYFPTNNTDPLITAHYEWLKPFFHHPNYIKVDGKPLFMLYQRKPGAMVVFHRLNELAQQDGFPGLYATVGLSKPHAHLLPMKDEKQERGFKVMMGRTLGYKVSNLKVYDKVVSYPNPSDWAEGRSLEIPSWCASVTASASASASQTRAMDIVGIISSFDNTPRRSLEEANLFGTGDPQEVVENFRKNLHSAIYYEACCFRDDKVRLQKKKQDDDRFIIINAMNEWAEGMALEPSDVYGRSFLETIRDTKRSIREKGCR
eukprot:CAMPEP_0194081936 /NCGR_PEP_ID=MMETSP0149-20130528/7578_1 /TAXON_ID=122233 /ORGANISM="Chaetoceros debilis, Strain MM31A-1" /LENGTH=518 /DNA_ID=CAMNT_0038763959 /DNA_START=55 /DNA_END=1611 /DNA_ORIENTATION=+